MNCNVCGKTMDSTATFCSQCGNVLYREPVYYPGQDRLIRPRYGRMIAGVCAGFALRYGWDVTLVRVALVLIVLLGAGSPMLAYLVAWIVMPNGPYAYMTQSPAPAPAAPPSETGATIS